MSPALAQLTKIRTFVELEESLLQQRLQGKTIVQCHGVFDLLHPGHIRHFREAKAQGDCLVVSVTPDRFVNKGPGRPAFHENFRLESLAALVDIDFVVLNDTPDAISAIQRIRPHLYVKGIEYKDHASDVTGKIAGEVGAVESIGGSIYYTNDVVFSSSSLLNRYFDAPSSQVVEFIETFKKHYSLSQVLHAIDSFKNLKVLVIGDAIIDEYQYTTPLGQSGKGIHMVARCLAKEVFLGGSLIIANHIAQFAGEVTLFSAVGKECPYLETIHNQLAPNVRVKFAQLEDTTTLIKKRYVLKDGQILTKLFETYSGQTKSLTQEQTAHFVRTLQEEAADYDLVIACDFGNGFTNFELIEAISSVDTFLALNTQINSGNRGYNVVTNYRRADYISLNEPELRLSAHDQTSSLEGLITDISELMHCDAISVTRGVRGALCYQAPTAFLEIPSFATTSIDRIGAGDSYLSLSALCLAVNHSSMLAGFLGSIAAAMSVQIVGNQESIQKAGLCKFVTRLMK